MKDQGHGSHWETVLGEESIVAKLKEIVQNSGLLSRKRTKVDFGAGPEEKDVFTLVCPTSEDSPLDFMTLLAENDGYNELVSAYPFVREGALLNGKITDIEIWNNNVEAVVTMEFGEDREISFFATDYNINKAKYQVGAYCDVRLAAFAYECNVLNTQDLLISLGDDEAKKFLVELEEDIRNEFGEDNAKKAMASVNKIFGVGLDDEIFLDASNTASLYPVSNDYKDDYRFQCPVQYVRTFEMMDLRMLQVEIFVGNFDVGLLPLPLFVRESMFGGQDNPKPETGQSVGGVCWLQGHLDKWYEGLEKPGSEHIFEQEPELAPEREQETISSKEWMSDILYESWEKFREMTSTWTNIDKERACQVFADIIRGSVPDEAGLFVQTNVSPKGSVGRKKVDIVCGFEEEGKVYSCAILLKVIDSDNAFTSKMFRIYKDLHFLESILDRQGDGQGYSECSFYLITRAEAFRTKPAYSTKSEDFPEFGLNGQTTVKYVRYHDDRESGERQELVFRKEYDITWQPQTGASDWHFLEIDINDEVVDCIVGVFRFIDEEQISYMHEIIDKNEYDGLTSRYPDRELEAAFRLSETPFDNAENQSWTMSNGKILYASDIKVSKSAHSVICDVLNDFLVINAAEMGGKTLRVKMEDRKLIKYFSEAEDYLLAGKEKSGIVGKAKAAYFEVDVENFE